MLKSIFSLNSSQFSYTAGNLKIVAHVLAVGKAISVKAMTGLSSNPNTGGTSAPVAKERTSPRVARASPPEC